MAKELKRKKHKRSRRAGPQHKGKICWGKCGEYLTLTSFSKNAGYSDGLRSYCKDCEVSYRRDRAQTYKRSTERYRLLNGRTRNYRTPGWEGRLRELRATGRVLPRGRRAAVERRKHIRLVCGKLIVCKPRKNPDRCPDRKPSE